MEIKVIQIATVSGGLEAPDGLAALMSDGTLWVRDRDPNYGQSGGLKDRGVWSPWVPMDVPPSAG